MILLVVMNPHKGDGYTGMPDPQIQGQFGAPLPGKASAVDGRRIYVFDVDAAFEIEEKPT